MSCNEKTKQAAILKSLAQTIVSTVRFNHSRLEQSDRVAVYRVVILPGFFPGAARYFQDSWVTGDGSFVANPDGPHRTALRCCPYLLVP